MGSTSEPLTGSPISRVPYDILREIFIHCLPRDGPQYPLRYRQSAMRVAPIQLCHVCSLWQRIALTFASLWVHLTYCLTVILEDEDDSDSGSRPIKFVAREIEFIRWWRMKHGSIAPFLSFSTRGRYLKDINHGETTQDGMDFLLEYIFSAQLLELESFYWHQIEGKITAGCQVIFPNLRTVLTDDASTRRDGPFYRVLAGLFPNHALPAMRHLEIVEEIKLENFDLPNHWSTHTLTHVVLRAGISLKFWVSFIRGVPNLQWGYFKISSLTGIDYTMPSKCILSQLTTLFVRTVMLPPHVESSLSLLFANLHLPALRTLSLSESALTHRSCWTDHRAIAELYGVLKSTPAITKLFLEDSFLSLCTRNTAAMLAPIEDVEPVWMHAPQLVDLQLDLSTWGIRGNAAMEAVADLFVRNIFCCDSGWLDLQNPACPIQSLAVHENGSAYDLRDFIMSSVQKNVGKTPRVALQITMYDARRIAKDVRDGWTLRV